MLRHSSFAAPFVLLLLPGCLHPRLAEGVRGDPNNDEAWGDAGDAEASMGNTAQALTDYQRALTIDPRDAEWQRKVAQYGGVESLRATIDLLLPDSSTDDETLGDRGDAFASAGLPEEACELYRRAQAIDAQDTEWLGKIAECAPAVLEAPSYEDNNGVLAMLGYVEGGVVGGVANQGYDYGQAGAFGAVALGDAAAVAASLEHARAGQKPESRNALWVALQADPNATDLRVMWALLTGETPVVLLQKLADAKPDDPALWGALGDAKLVAGKRAEAIVAWQKAATLAPNDLAWSNRLEMAKNTVVK